MSPLPLRASTRRAVLGMLAYAASATRASGTGRRLLVAAASDLQIVLPDIAATFRAASGVDVAISFGSTGNLARQIRQGAPFEVFFAADERFIADLHRDGHVVDAGAAYARGILALAVNRTGRFAAATSLGEVEQAARAGEAFRIAIANPEHAPYGARAMEVIQASASAAALTARLVFGESVTQAHQMVASGAAAVGITAMSLAQAAATVAVTPVPSALHSPLVQRLAVTKRGGAEAKAFAAHVLAPPAQDLLAARGFGRP